MDTFSAFGRGQAAAARKARHQVFDWDKAAQMIRDAKPCIAEAFLASDEEWTGGIIYQDGVPVTKEYTYLASNWATPTLRMDGVEHECWVYCDEHPEWDAGTKWPESSVRILDGSPTPNP